MKILYIHQYFKTPEDGGCIRSYHLAKGLVAAGHEVIMITAHNQESYLKLNIEGITVHYLPVLYDNSFSFIKRGKAFLSFLFKSLRVAKKEDHIDLAYIMTTPLSTALIALYLKVFRRIPYFFEVGDLWPEVPVKMGLLNNFFLKNLAYLLESLAYRHARKLVALSPGIAEYMRHIQPEKSIAVIPNIADIEFYEPSHKKETNKFSILYCGAIGIANHLEYLIDFASEAEKANLPVHFTIIGDGGRKEVIASRAQKLENVTILPFINREGLKTIIDAHDAFYVSFKNIDVLHTGSPNKYFDGLAAGKLMILNLGGWLKELTELNSCGFSYSPENPGQAVKKLLPYLENDQLLKNAQENSRSLSESFTVEVSQKKLLEFIGN